MICVCELIHARSLEYIEEVNVCMCMYVCENVCMGVSDIAQNYTNSIYTHTFFNIKYKTVIKIFQIYFVVGVYIHSSTLNIKIVIKIFKIYFFVGVFNMF